MYEMSQWHPVWVAENHVNPCNSVEVIPLSANEETVSLSQLRTRNNHFKTLEKGY
jgi:hypothetical protein